MSSIEHSQKDKSKSYDDIALQTRIDLIRLIENKKWTIKAAAKQTKIKESTAKQIIGNFRKKGKIVSKKGVISSQQINLEQIQNFTSKTCETIYFPIYIYVPVVLETPPSKDNIKIQNQ